MNQDNTPKTLTFIIPCYNSSETLKDCLDSLYDTQVLEEIEVLIVNDGSTDNTSEIAAEFAERHPSFRLIDKENGGHGSVINLASGIAQGKYLKVLDSDDKVTNLKQYVTALREVNVDVVLTHFNAIDFRTGHTRPYNMSNVDFGRIYTFEEFWSHKKDIYQVMGLHGITYRSDFYRSCNLKLSERISYEDQEFATIPFINVKTVLPVDLYVYVYYIGYPGQSIADANQVKRLPQMEMVLWKIEGSIPKTVSKSVYSYFIFKMREVMIIYYLAALVRSPNKKEGRAQAKAMHMRIRECQSDLYAALRKQYIFNRIISYLGINGDIMSKLRNLRIYRFFTRFIH